MRGFPAPAGPKPDGSPGARLSSFLFRFDLVAYIFGGQTATVSRVVYTLVGLAAIWCISLLFRRSLVEDGE